MHLKNASNFKGFIYTRKVTIIQIQVILIIKYFRVKLQFYQLIIIYESMKVVRLLQLTSKRVGFSNRHFVQGKNS